MENYWNTLAIYPKVLMKLQKQSRWWMLQKGALKKFIKFTGKYSRWEPTYCKVSDRKKVSIKCAFLCIWLCFQNNLSPEHYWEAASVASWLVRRMPTCFHHITIPISRSSACSLASYSTCLDNYDFHSQRYSM